MANVVHIKTECVGLTVMAANDYFLCDSYKMLCDVWPAKFRFTSLLFGEIRALYYMITLRNGYIIKKETCIEYVFKMGAEEYTFYCNPFIDAICRKYEVYPPWLDIPYMDELKLPFTLNKKRL